MKLRLLVAICVLLIPVSVFAGEFSFRCTVKNEYQLTDDGQLDKPDKFTYYPSASFSVERSTGKIVGGSLDNKADFQIKVVDSGDNGSFKVFSFAKERKVAESLTIITRQKEKGETGPPHNREQPAHRCGIRALDRHSRSADLRAARRPQTPESDRTVGRIDGRLAPDPANSVALRPVLAGSGASAEWR